MRSLTSLWREWTLTPTHTELLSKMCCRPGWRRKEILILAGDRALIDQSSINRMLHERSRWLAYDELAESTRNMKRNHDGEWIDVGSTTGWKSVGSSLIHGWEPRIHDIPEPEEGMIIVDAWEFARLLRDMPLQKNRDPDYLPEDVRQWMEDYVKVKQTH